MIEIPLGIPIVISSPSGGGKTTIYNELAKRHPEFFYSVSATTRPRRPNEEDGVQYHFLDSGEFLRREKRGAFIETALVHGYRYGTPREPMERALEDGRKTVLDIDVQGGDSIRRLYPNALLIFIVPPGLATLRSRLENRRSEGPEAVQRRMKNALDELRRAPDYDHIVVNDDLRRAVDEVEAIIEDESRRRADRRSLLVELFPEIWGDA
jgi:guanylate kinase